MSGVRRFACTMCGKCCDRAPEVELSEAAALADMFVFRLMFRLYTQPRAPRGDGSGSAEVFHQRKKLLSAHAVRVYSRKVAGTERRPIEVLSYLMISALALDTRPGACAASAGGACGIYDRRPLTCRTVPFHYSRPEALAVSDLDGFVTTSGYACDVSESAPVVIENGLVVDSAAVDLRVQALSMAKRDRLWKQAIVRRMKSCQDGSLPAPQTVEDNAMFGAMTTSMRIGWQIGAEAAMISDRECVDLVETQLRTIEREIESGRARGRDSQTLLEMRAEYRHALAGH